MPIQKVEYEFPDPDKTENITLEIDKVDKDNKLLMDLFKELKNR